MPERLSAETSKCHDFGNSKTLFIDLGSNTHEISVLGEAETIRADCLGATPNAGGDSTVVPIVGDATDNGR